MQDAKLTLLYNHYKDTFASIQDYLKHRDRLFLFVLVVVTLLLFEVYSPSGFAEAISQFITKKLELKTAIDVSFVASVIWFVLLSLVVRYYQTVVHIERQYDYIHKLEEHLSAEYDGKAFTREGKSYLQQYPLFSHWARILYTFIFPIFLVIIVVFKIIGEFCYLEKNTPLLYINFFIAICIVVSTLLYLLLVHWKK